MNAVTTKNWDWRPDGNLRTVSVIAGGWSLARLTEAARARIPRPRIGVNDSFLLLDCDTGLSMDRVWMEERWDRVAARDRKFWTRPEALRNIAERPDWLQIFECDYEAPALSVEPGQLNGGNSGVCAINLAMQLEPARIILWGFDMVSGPQGEVYWYPAYPWSKRKPAPNRPFGLQSGPSFETIAEACSSRGIDVVNASPHSIITAFEKANPWDLLTPTT